MTSCTSTSNRETTLLSRALLPQQDEAAVRPQPAPTTRILASAVAAAAPWRRREDSCARVALIPAAAFEGGAVAGSGGVSVTDQMVTDHKYSTRLGLFSCRPPV